MKFVLAMFLQPGLILIDHGHFQYNTISLGLALWAIVGVVMDYHLFGVVAFCLALNYKQMELYHALPFFCFLLGKSLHHSKGYVYTVAAVFKLGVFVLLTFSLCWIPFYVSGGIDGMYQVLTRIFPFGRGLFEDKVASFWCAISVAVKMKQIFSVPSLIRVSLLTTLVSSLPSLWKLTWSPSPYRFLLSLVSQIRANKMSIFKLGFLFIVCR